MTDIITIIDKCLGAKGLQDKFDLKNISLYKIRGLIRTVIDYIGKEVTYFDETVTLSWEHVERYITRGQIRGAQLILNWHAMILEVFNEHVITEKFHADTVVDLKFSELQTAHAFFDFFVTLLPLINTEYPKIIDNSIQLTNEQYCFYQRCAIAKTGNLPAEYLGDSFLKTLRADTFDFSYAFILGIIPGENGTRRHQNLRPTSRKPFTITPQGEVTPRHEKPPMHTPQDKQGFSQIQPCTLIDTKALSPPFGFVTGRNSKLYGLMTHIDDTVINRMLIEDSGTVARPFDHESSFDAERISENLKNPKQPHLFSPEEMANFKSSNLKLRPKSRKTNEVLARLRFNPYRSVVSICTDTLEARLLAYDFAEELLEHYANYAKKNGAELNPNFKIPIIFYATHSPNTSGVGNHKHELRLYTAAMRHKDQEEALFIFKENSRRQAHYRHHDYEFLLALQNLTPEILLERIDAVPLALAMMRNGYTRMLMRLLRPTRHCGGDRVFDSLLSEGLIEQNDPIIAQLILVEAFDIAEKLIFTTKSDKYQLMVGNTPLVVHLCHRGNPRQLNYMGLDYMLHQAAGNSSWVSIRLCLKEYPNVDKTFLVKLFEEACMRKHYKEVELFLQMGVTIERVRSEILEAVKSKDWTLVKLFTQYHIDVDGTLRYGYALLEALREGQRELAKLLLRAGATTSWRDGMNQGNYTLLSTVAFAITQGFNELLPALVEHETRCQDEFSQARLRLAQDLAYERGNKDAARLLEKNIDAATLIDPDNIKKSICTQIFEAISIGQRNVAELRLMRYCHQYELLPENNHSVTDGLMTIKEHFREVLQSYKTVLVAEETLAVLIRVVLSDCDALLLQSILILTAYDYTGLLAHAARSLIYKSILNAISIDNLHIIKEVLEEYGEKEFWQEALNNQFHERIRLRETANQALLLIHLGASLPESTLCLAFECAVYHQREHLKLTDTLVTSPNMNEPLREKLLCIAIENCTTPYFAFLMEKYKFTVNMKHIKVAANTPEVDWILLSLLDAIDIKQFSPRDHYWDFYSAWARISFQMFSTRINGRLHDRGGLQYLTCFRDPTVIQHFTLVNLAVIFSSVFRTHSYKAVPSNISHVLKHQEMHSLEKRIEHYLDRYTFSLADFEKYGEILKVLNDYFSDSGTFPDETTIVRTYKIMQEFFGKMKRNVLTSYLFFQCRGRLDFDTDIYDYLQYIDQTLTNNLKAPNMSDKTAKGSVNTQIFENYASSTHLHVDGKALRFP